MVRNERSRRSAGWWFMLAGLTLTTAGATPREANGGKPGVAADIAIDATVDFTGIGPVAITGLIEDSAEVRRGGQFMRDGEWWDRLLFIEQFGTFEIELPLLAERQIEYPFEMLSGTGGYAHLNAFGTATGRTHTKTRRDPWWGSVIYIKTVWHMEGSLLP